MALLAAERVTKTYTGVRALTAVDLEVDRGEIHALLGQNGAGKSTLMKVIAGSVAPDSGAVRVDGKPIEPGSPEEARAGGIGLVHQEMSLVPTLSVAENVLLGRWPMARRQVDWPALRETASRSLERVGFSVAPETRVSDLGMAERQLVELAKALSLDVSVLLLDEPTSALSERETRRLFEICRALRDQGVAMVYVSHRLSEIVEICDRVSVLRDGRNVSTVSARGLEESRLAELMVGSRENPAEAAARASDRGHSEPRTGTGERRPAALRIEGLARPPRLKPCGLELRGGEIVSVFGLVGAGRTRLARSLFGLEPAERGRIEIDGSERRIRGPIDAIKAGIGYVGEDRSAGLVPRLSVAANISLASLSKASRGGLLDFKSERRMAERSIEELGIRVSSPDQPAAELSGGNQQKLVLARWAIAGARILILDDPTRGIDVGAKAEVFRLVADLAADGVAVLFFTSEIAEAKALGERIVVMADGRIAAELESEASDERIMTAAGGAYA